ncbi:hypothetical protein D3C76_946560 [compost metagenome]
MAIGAVLVIIHVRRIGNDQVEPAFDAAQQITVVSGHIRGARQLRIDRCQTHGSRVDVHCQDVGFIAHSRDDYRADARPATNVHGTLDGFETLLKQRLDRLGEAVGIRAEKH